MNNFKKLYQALPIFGPVSLNLRKKSKYLYSKVYYCRIYKLNAFYRILLFVPSLFLWYCKAIIEIVSQLNQFSAEVKRTENIRILSQVRQLLNLAFIKNAPPDLYYYLKLYNKRFTIAENYLVNSHICPILGFLAKDKAQQAIICDKYEFWLKLLPIIPYQAEIGAVISKSKIEFLSPYDDLSESDYFLKPIHGFGGKDCQRISYLGNFLFKSEPLNLTFDKSNLKKYLMGIAKSEDFILQPILINHPEVMVLSNGSLATSRIVTYLDKHDEIQVLFAQLYMPVDKSIISNGNAIGCAVNIDTGILSSAIHLSNPFEPVDFHPNVKGKITGSVLPFWPEAIAICKKAHHEFLDLPIIGWDIAFTPDGPILIEGNLVWDVEYWQLTHRGVFNSAVFIEIVERCLNQKLNMSQ